MNLELIIILLTFTANIVLGFFTYLRNPKSHTNILFTSLTLIISLWTLFNYFSLKNLNDPAITLFWIRAVMFVTAPLGPTILLLVHTFPHKKIIASKLVIILLLVLTLASALLAPTSYLFAGVDISPQGVITPQPAPAILVYAVTFLGSLLAAFGVIIKKFWTAKGLERVQLKYLLLGIIITFTLVVITNFVFVLLLNISQFVILGPVFSLILVGFIAYAIVKHRFMDIGFVVARTVSYALLLSTLSIFYGLILFFGSSIIFDKQLDYETTLIAILLALIIAFSFDPLNNFLKRITNRIFYKGGYEANQILYDFVLRISAHSKINYLINEITNFFVEIFHVNNIEFVAILDDDLNNFNVENSNEIQIDLDVQNSVKQISSIKVADELDNSKLKSYMLKNNIAVIIPLISEGKKLGFIFVENKKSGDVFNSLDISIFEIIAPQIAIALTNAKRVADELQREKEISENKTKFLTVAGHKLRTPLSGIKWAIDLILNEEKKNLNKNVKDAVLQIAENSDRMVTLVNDLLEVQTMVDSKYQPTLKETELKINDSINNILIALENQIKNKKIKLSLKSNVRDTVGLSIDPDKFDRSIREILQNAITYNKNDGTGSIGINIKKTNEHLEITIVDNGKGIKKDEMPNIFEVFYRGKDALLTETEGNGIGLYLVKQYIESWHGKLEISSEYGEGTKVTISLPLIQNKSH